MHGRKIGAMNQVEVVSRTQNSMHNKGKLEKLFIVIASVYDCTAFGQIASLSQ